MFRQPFIEGWDFVSILGEGSFGQVKLAMNTKNNSNLIAVKIIELCKVKDYRTIEKEICIHKSLTHDRIVKFYGYRKEAEEIYVFMEYISGGELYHLIEPGSAMNENDCFRLFSQLLDGVDYMHNKGIVHRDIKLENLLIDENDNLKITDFGLSTMFRFQGKERLLERLCGSVPYAAPELLAGRKHKAEPVDIWSCGIILYIMYQGEMPWDSANEESKEYSLWAKATFPSSRWGRLSKYQIDVLRKILDVNPEKRATIVQIKQSRWFKISSKGDAKLHSIGSKLSNPKNGNRYCMSQPQNIKYPLIEDIVTFNIAPNANQTDDAFFSQPVQTDYILATQVTSNANEGFPQTFVEKLTKRLTRFIVSGIELTTLISHLSVSLDAAGCSWKLITQKCFAVLMNDVRNQNLNFKIHLFCPPNGKTLVDFRLYRGDGLEFKRIYKQIKEKMVELVPSLE